MLSRPSAASPASGCGTRLTAAWRSAASPSSPPRPRHRAESRRGDRPRMLGRRSPSWPASRASRPRKQRPHLFQRAGFDHAVEARLDPPVKGLGAVRLEHEARRVGRREGAAACSFPAATPKAAVPVASSTSSARRMRCGSLGADRRRGRRVARFERAHAAALRPLPRAAPSNAARISARDRGNAGEALRQRLEIKAGAADHDWQARPHLSASLKRAPERRRARPPTE